MKGEVRNSFTVDVEDYFHVSAFAHQIKPGDWGNYESRVVANTHRILKLLDHHQVPGTFFVLGWVARHYPQLVKDIQNAGHEVANHSYWHRQLFDLTPEEFRQDLLESKQVLEEITGVPVRAYRAPSFSITKKSEWALEILQEEGFLFDSSIFPVYHDRYGMPGAPRFPNKHDFPNGTIWELPPSTIRFAGLNVPIAGGGYFRLLPVNLTAHFFRSLNSRLHQPFMFYIHPWEIDPDQPRIPCPARVRWRHYLNLRSVERKLETLLKGFRYGTLDDLVRQSAEVTAV